MAVKSKKLWSLLGVMFLAIAVRVFYLTRTRDFWHDEAFQYLYSLKPLEFILTANDVHPPLFNIFTKFLLWIGITDPIVLRFVILYISVVAVGLFFLMIWELFGDEIAIMSGIILAVMPTYAYYGTEFRNYSFALMLVIMQIYYFNRLLKNDNPLHSLLYAIMTTAMIYSHYLTGLIVLSQIIYILWREPDKRETFTPPIILSGLWLIPIVFYTINMYLKIQSFWFNNIDLWSLFSTFAYMFSPPSDHILFVQLLCMVFLVGTIVAFYKKIDNRHLQFLMYATVPPVTMWLISQVFPFYHHRYFIFGGIGLFVIIAWGIKEFAKTLPITAHGLYLIIVISAIMAYPLIFDNTELHDSAIVLGRIKDDYVVIHDTTFSQSPYKVYLPEHKHYLVNSLTREQLFTAGGSVVEDWERADSIQEVLYENANKSAYYVSDKCAGKNIIFEEGGLCVTKIQ